MHIRTQNRKIRCVDRTTIYNCRVKLTNKGKQQRYFPFRVFNYAVTKLLERFWESNKEK